MEQSSGISVPSPWQPEIRPEEQSIWANGSVCSSVSPQNCHLTRTDQSVSKRNERLSGGGEGKKKRGFSMISGAARKRPRLRRKKKRILASKGLCHSPRHRAKPLFGGIQGYAFSAQLSSCKQVYESTVFKRGCYWLKKYGDPLMIGRIFCFTTEL